MTRLEEIVLKEKRVLGLMKEKNLEGILLKKQPNFSWFTAGGYNMVGIATEMGMTSLLITPKARYVVSNRIEAPRMMEDEGLADLGFQLLEHPWYVDGETDLIRKAAGDLSRVGADIPFGPCPNLDGDIKKLRYALTEGEIERYLFLGEKLSAAIEKVALGVRPGDVECEIAGRLAAELWKDRIDPTGFQVAADERVYRFRHPIPTTRRVEKYFMVSVNARYKGLITTITRIGHLGKPAPRLQKQFFDNCEIECRMIAATKPGIPFAVPFQVALEAYKELGYEKEWELHHQGGAMGYYARDIRVASETRDLVAANQAVCWNPSIAGTKTEDAFIAAPDGPRMITYPVLFPRIQYPRNGEHLERPGMLVLD